jgi:type IV pilus assembly protein PilP
MISRTPFNRITALVLLPATLLVSGCQSDNMDDLRGYVAEIKTIRSGPVPPLPDMKPYERYLYRSGDAGARDPFQPISALPKEAQIAKKTDPNRSKYAEEIETHNPEELESHELDSLRMVGTLNNDNELWGVVMDHDGMVHRVAVGNYLGKNYGKVINISEDHIELREIISDGQGSFEERQATVTLADASAATKKP